MNRQINDFDMKKLCKTTLAQRPFFFAVGERQSGRRHSLGLQLNPVKRAGSRSGFTLVETMMSILIITMFFSTILLGYTRAGQRAQWSGFSLAAQGQSMK